MLALPSWPILLSNSKDNLIHSGCEMSAAPSLAEIGGSVAEFAVGCECLRQQANQAAMSNSSATKVAWACMSLPPILRNCPFLTIAITS